MSENSSHKNSIYSDDMYTDGEYIDINSMAFHVTSGSDSRRSDSRKKASYSNSESRTASSRSRRKTSSDSGKSRTRGTRGREIEQQSFLQGAMVLTVSIVIVKIIGMLFKVLFANIVDGVGNGMFNSAYELYNVIFTVASAGFPIALSRMVAEYVSKKRYKDVRRLHRISIPFFLITGIVCFVLMIAVSGLYAKMVGNSDVQLPIIALSPIVLFGCLMSIYRGYFEGMRYMVPTAVSEIIEVSGKLLVGLSLSYIVNTWAKSEYAKHQSFMGVDLSGYGATEVKAFISSWTVAAAFVGVAFGSFCGFVYLMIKYNTSRGGITRRQLRNSPAAEESSALFKKLTLTAIPIGLGAFVMSIASTIDSILVNNRIVSIMQSGQGHVLQSMYPFLPPEEIFTMTEAGEYTIQVFLFGCYGYSLTFLMLVTSVTQVFGQSAMPALTSAWTVKDKALIKSNINTILKVTLLVTLPAGIGLSVLAKPLLTMLYGVRIEVSIARSVLQVMGISSIFIATSTPICSMLQAIGRVDMPLKLYSVGMIIKIAINYILVGIPQINIQGAAVGSLVAYLFVSVVGIYIIAKDTGVIPDFRKILVKPLFAAVCCGVSASLVNRLVRMILKPSALPLWANRFLVVPSLIVALLVYFAVLILIRGITEDDLNEMPGGNKIAKILAKYKLLR